MGVRFLSYLFTQLKRSIGVFFRTIKAFFTRKLTGLASGLRRLFNFSRHATKAATSSLQDVVSAAQKPSRPSDYVETSRLFISKALLIRLALGAVALGLIFYFLIWPFILSHFLTAKFYVKDSRVEDWSGRVIVYSDEKKTIPLYSGRLEDGVLQGECKQYDDEGILIYEGQIVDGERTGSGKEYENGVLVYEGQFSTGLYDGYGIRYKDGKISYSGQYEKGKRSGNGKEYENGTLSYEGQFTADLYNGYGTQYKAGKVWYSGQYENGKRSGSGKEYENGTLLYEGQFLDNLYEGRGKLYKNEKLIYDGTFHAGSAEGSGTAYYLSGKISYQGQFTAGRKDGSGVAYNEDGSKLYEGGFAEDEYSGSGTLYFDDGSQLEASFLGGVPSGNVQWKRNGFLYYQGEWADDAPNGFGTLYNKAGKVIYEGPFLGGTLDGSRLLGYTTEELRTVLGECVLRNEGQKKGFLTIADELGLAALCTYQTEAEESKVCKICLSVPEQSGWVRLMPGMDHTADTFWPEGTDKEEFLTDYTAQTGVNLASSSYVAACAETEQQRLTALYSELAPSHALLLIWERSDLAPSQVASGESATDGKVEELLDAMDKMISSDGTVGSNGAAFGGTGSDTALAAAGKIDDAVTLTDAMIDFWEQTERLHALEELYERNETLLSLATDDLYQGVGSPEKVASLEQQKVELETQIVNAKTAIKRAEIQAEACGVSNPGDFALAELLVSFDPGAQDISELVLLSAAYAKAIGSEESEASIEKQVKDSLLDLSDTHSAAKLALSKYQALASSASSALADYSMGLCSKDAWYAAMDEEALARVELYAVLADFSKQANHFNQLTGGWVSRTFNWHQDVFEPLLRDAIVPDEPVVEPGGEEPTEPVEPGGEDPTEPVEPGGNGEENPTEPTTPGLG